MAKHYNHFESYEWLGLFWNPVDEIEFPGKLLYSPEDGVTLEFMYSMDQRFQKTSFIYGALSTGEICTLFGNMDPETFGMSFGKIAIYKGKPKFHAAIFGAHATPEDLFAGFTLDLTNFQEFCHPQGFKDSAKYSLEPLYQGKVSNLEISITNTGKFGYLSENLENLIHCENDEVVEKITHAILEITKQYEDVEILQRKDIGWEFQAENSKGMSFAEINKNILLLEYLISLLIFSPVRRTEASVLVKSEVVEQKFERRSLLTSFFDMSNYKVQVLKREISNGHQAITPNNIENFSKVISNWFQGNQAHQAFASQIANRFGKYHEHEIKASVVLHLVQLEFISSELGHSGEKYKFPFEKYDQANIRDFIAKIFGIADTSKIGEMLSKLRAEIAHLKASIKILPRIGTRGLMQVNRCLEIIIASHIYESLEIAPSNIANFQINELRKIQ